MIYGKTQYYNAELDGWLRTLGFRGLELNELVMQLHIVLQSPVVSPSVSKACNKLLDELLSHEEQFSNIRGHFDQQSQRITKAIIVGDKLEHSVIQIQDSCRNSMKTFELAFVRSKYECGYFLSTFFLVDHVPAS